MLSLTKQSDFQHILFAIHRIPTRSTSTLNGFVPLSVKALDSSDLATSPIKLGLQE